MDARLIETILIPLLTIVGGVITAFATSSGFWAHKTTKSQKTSAEDKLLRGLAHTRLMTLCEKYIERGWITPEEYEDLIIYLYQPYIELGGNGTVKKMVDTEINKLPVRHMKDHADILRKEIDS